MAQKILIFFQYVKVYNFHYVNIKQKETHLFQKS